MPPQILFLNNTLREKHVLKRKALPLLAHLKKVRLSWVTSCKVIVDFSLLVSLAVHAFVVNKLNSSDPHVENCLPKVFVFIFYCVNLFLCRIMVVLLCLM